MTAVLIPTASEAEWLEARRQGVTASEIAVLMGLGPYSSPYALYHQKLGILPDQADQAVFERGRVLEPYVAGKFAESHPQFAVLGDGRELFAHPVSPWQMATPDRRVHKLAHHDGKVIGVYVDPCAVLECKVDGGSDEWGEEGTDEIPVHYRAQVLWQCDVMGVRRWYAAALRVRDWRIRIYTGEIDEAAEADLELMRREALDFLKRLENGEPPDVDWRPQTTDALRKLHSSVTDDEAVVGRQLVISYRSACRRYKEAERRKKLAENRLRERMGSSRSAVDARTGETVARRQVYDVKESTRKAYLVDKLVAAK